MEIGFLPLITGPSANLAVPYSLASLRTSTVGIPVSRDKAVAIGIPPISSPASKSVSAGIKDLIDIYQNIRLMFFQILIRSFQLNVKYHKSS